MIYSKPRYGYFGHLLIYYKQGMDIWSIVDIYIYIVYAKVIILGHLLIDYKPRYGYFGSFVDIV